MDLKVISYKLRGVDTTLNEYLALFATVSGLTLSLYVVGNPVLAETYTASIDGDIVDELIVSSEVAPYLEENLGFYAAKTYYVGVTINSTRYNVQGPGILNGLGGYDYTLVDPSVITNVLAFSAVVSSVGNQWRVAYPDYLSFSQFPTDFTDRDEDLFWSLSVSAEFTKAIYNTTDCTNVNSCYFCDGVTTSCPNGFGCFNLNNTWQCLKSNCGGSACGDTIYNCSVTQSTNGTNFGNFTCTGAPVAVSCTNGVCPSGQLCSQVPGTTSFACQFVDSNIATAKDLICPDSNTIPCGSRLDNGSTCPGVCLDGQSCQLDGTKWGCVNDADSILREPWFIVLMVLLILGAIVFIGFLLYWFSGGDNPAPPGRPTPLSNNEVYRNIQTTTKPFI